MSWISNWRLRRELRHALRGLEGVFLVALGDRTLLWTGVGGARPGEVRPTASLAKQVTAAAVLKLQEQGRLSVDDPLSRWMPDAPSDKAAITLHQLLTHTAGFVTDVYDPLRCVEREEARRLILEAPLERAPGEAYGYSSADYLLLAMVVETASGRPFDAFLHETFFAPAGMTSTAFPGCGYPRRRVRRVASAVLAEPATQGWYRRGGGGLLTTADDWLRWERALFGGALLSAESLRTMRTAHAPVPGEAASASYGWIVEAARQGVRLRHSGHWRDNHSLVFVEPEAGLIMLGFSTSSVEAFDRAWARMHARVTG